MTAFASDTATRISLIIGSVAFGLFWGSTLVDLQAPWMISLGMHGLSIILISFGLINRQRTADGSQFHRRLGWTAVAVTIAGLLTVVPLFATGFALVGLSLLTWRRWLPGAVLTLGGLVFFAAYVFGTRIGDEAASKPDAGLSVIFAVALVLIVGGLSAIGVRPLVGYDGAARG